MHKIKRIVSSILAILSLSICSMEVFAVETYRIVKEAGFSYKAISGELSKGKFALCEDLDGDGKFTRGKDDAKVYYASPNLKGMVKFKNLKTDTIYFITQIEADAEYDYIDTNVYSFALNNSDAAKDFVDLLEYLPSETYTASKRLPLDSLYLDYRFESPSSRDNISANCISNAEFAICSDVDGNGEFTKGVDNIIIYKSHHKKNGEYWFGKTDGSEKKIALRTDKTYFITQLKGGEEQALSFTRDKNIYPFRISSIELGWNQGNRNLNAYLPFGTYIAKPKINTRVVSYAINFDSNYELVEDVVFGICPDIDNDGRFTKGIDDKKIYKAKSGESFTALECNKRYFITQLSATDSSIVCNKKIYSFIIDYETAYKKSTYLNDYLPINAFMVKRNQDQVNIPTPKEPWILSSH